MDADYARNLAPDGSPCSEFEHSLFVLATVMSRPTTERAVLDAGHKALSIDAGLPWVVGMPDVEYVRAADEHGKLTLRDPTRVLDLGTRSADPSCDPTVNLYDFWFVAYRNDQSRRSWPHHRPRPVC
jgi:D-serine deaminase-like pyridoxal phosphate-dependent protein